MPGLACTPTPAEMGQGWTGTRIATHRAASRGHGGGVCVSLRTFGAGSALKPWRYCLHSWCFQSLVCQPS